MTERVVTDDDTRIARRSWSRKHPTAPWHVQTAETREAWLGNVQFILNVAFEERYGSKGQVRKFNDDGVDNINEAEDAKAAMNAEPGNVLKSTIDVVAATVAAGICLPDPPVQFDIVSIVIYPHQIDANLKAYGDNGFNLVSTHPIGTERSPSQYRLFFQRPRPRT